MTNNHSIGLLNMEERDLKKVTSSFQGSVFGNGMYMNEHPMAFYNQGNIGLLIGPVG